MKVSPIINNGMEFTGGNSGGNNVPPPIGFDLYTINIQTEHPGQEVGGPSHQYPAILESQPVPGLGFEPVTSSAEPAQNADTLEQTVTHPPDQESKDAHNGTEPASPTSPTGSQSTKTSTMHFRDGKRRIDFVLAFVDENKDGGDAEEGKDCERKAAARRQLFEQNLLEEGLELEHEDKKDGKTHFVKIHAPWEVLSRVAELMSLKMPIKNVVRGNSSTGNEYDIEHTMENYCAVIKSPFRLPEHLVKEEPDYFTANFSIARENMFIIENKDTFFTDAQRSLMVYEILLRARYEPEKEKFGIDRLLKNSTYTAAFPLHDGPYTSDHSILTRGPKCDRHLLHEAWARAGRWYNYQPLDLVRRYFGEKVGIYFAWLGFYMGMLIPASMVGLVAFIYGCATLLDNHSSEELCDLNRAGNLTMCPLCDGRCSYWRLHTSCSYARLTYLFDNYATVAFAAFMSIWATMFLEFWKRKQGEIQYDWDVADFELEEHMRPDFEVKCPKKKLNPVTQMMEPYVPFYNRVSRRLASVVVVLFMISCVIAAVFGVIMYRIIVVALLYSAPNDVVRTNAKIATSVTAACCNLVVILLLNRVYEKVAVFLTEMERCKTDSEYEDSFTFKMFLFQFINYYSSIFYIAFFKGRLGGRPGDYDYRLGYRTEECDPAGCLAELCIQLGVVMVGKQAINNVQEVILPKFMNWLRARKNKDVTDGSVEGGSSYTRWERDYDLTAQQELGLFNEYLEMVIQYGFVTIFVAAFPLAPFFALINNVIEIRVDAFKFVTQWRRPVANRAQDIGIWYPILQGVSFIAVLSNAFIIGWTSDFVPKMVYKSTPEYGSLGSYNEWSLSVFDVQDFQNRSVPDDPQVEEFGVVEYCRYKDWRNPPGGPDEYKYTAAYWHVFMARLAFVIVFEHLVFLLASLVAYTIPDRPWRVRQLLLRERFLAKEARYTTVFSGMHEDKQRRRESEAKWA